MYNAGEVTYITPGSAMLVEFYSICYMPHTPCYATLYAPSSMLHTPHYANVSAPNKLLPLSPYRSASTPGLLDPPGHSLQGHTSTLP